MFEKETEEFVEKQLNNFKLFDGKNIYKYVHVGDPLEDYYKNLNITYTYSDLYIPQHVLSENCIDISLPGVTKKEIKKLQIVNGNSLVVAIETDSLFAQSGEYTYDLENKFKLNGEACLENGILSVTFKPVYQTKDIEIIEDTPS